MEVVFSTQILQIEHIFLLSFKKYLYKAGSIHLNQYENLYTKLGIFQNLIEKKTS